jgi:hypothetical protein
MRSKEEKEKIKKELQYGILEEKDLDNLSSLIKNMNDDGSGRFNLRSMEPEYYHWMYFRNPAGKAIVYCARHNGKIIGSFAMAPKKMQINGKYFLCGKTMDMFTDPAYQGLGLMTQLANRVFESSKKQQLNLWYVTPSKNSYPIFKNKWKYIESFEITYMMKFLEISPLLESKIKSKVVSNIVGFPIKQIQKLGRLFSKSLSNYAIEEIYEFDIEADKLWENINKNLKISLLKNSEYMNWRYVDNPDDYSIFAFKRDGQLQGLLILKFTVRRGLKVGEIVDYVCDAEDYNLRQSMFKYAIKYFRDNDCAVCQSWVIDGSEMEKEIRKSGIGYKRNKLKFLLSPDSSIKQFYEKQNWMITQGDGNDV